MGIQEQVQVESEPKDDTASPTTCRKQIVEPSLVSPDDEALERILQQHYDAPLHRILATEAHVPQEDTLDSQARRHGFLRLSANDISDATVQTGDANPQVLIRHGVAPLKDGSGREILALAHPDADRGLSQSLSAKLGHADRALANLEDIQGALATSCRAALTTAASSRVAEAYSCRTWGNRPRLRLAMILGGLTALIAATLYFPTLVFALITAWAVVTLLVSAGLKTAAYVAGLLRQPDAQPEHTPPPNGRLPKVSVLVPLYKEREVAHALIARLRRLTYPKCLLDVVLVLEEKDDLTRETLKAIDLPIWIRIVEVPDAQLKTKPRAMNYALDFCQGDIIGIYDAEDAPEPEQITKVARHFQNAPVDVVCVQGILDYYNPRQTWMARCFTIEYATWFRLMLPGMSRLGLAIPLGGTTLFFKRKPLEEIGGWDAHNVTEDADLGFRLARYGYRTEMIDMVTGEEANCRIWPWIKQRSRWLKGYMVTYLVHMRNPLKLHRELGARKFWGFQAHFVSALSQVVLAPFLWSFWLILLGLPHPLDNLIERELLTTVAGIFLVVEALNVAVHATAVSGRDHKHLLPWVPTMHFYAPLGAFAAYKALYELIFAPYFWDKTSHGHSLKNGPVDHQVTL